MTNPYRGMPRHNVVAYMSEVDWKYSLAHLPRGFLCDLCSNVIFILLNELRSKLPTPAYDPESYRIACDAADKILELHLRGIRTSRPEKYAA